tara:strand:- start:183 stop:983 length:801 start_codon:yes stop_codon:yes gene_type:complete
MVSLKSEKTGVKPTNLNKQDWEINPHNYIQNEDGSFVLKKDGTPRKKAGRPLGCKDTLEQKVTRLKKKEAQIKRLVKDVQQRSLDLPAHKRNSSTIPFGYTLNFYTQKLEPVENELEALKKVEENILNGHCSLREGTAYLLEKTKRYLSAPGLRKIMQKKYGKDCCSQSKEKGWLYIVESLSIPGWIKFGKSINPEKRLQQYNANTPLKDYILVEVCPCSNMKKGEKVILNVASFFAEEEKGEWKKINKKLALDIFQTYHKKYETK